MSCHIKIAPRMISTFTPYEYFKQEKILLICFFNILLTNGVFPWLNMIKLLALAPDWKYCKLLFWPIVICLSWLSISNLHYTDIIMGTIASQITSLTIFYSTVYSDADQRKHQSSASVAFVRGIHRGPVNSPHKWPLVRKMFSFDDVIMDRKRPRPQLEWYMYVPLKQVIILLGNDLSGS